MLFRKIYYLIKPLIPRRIQILLRRQLIRKKRRRLGEGWYVDADSGNPPVGWRGWPDDKRFAVVLTHDVDTERGQSRCFQLMKLEKKCGFVSSYNFVPGRYGDLPELRHTLTRNGFEVGVHDLYHDGSLYKSRSSFASQSVVINRYLKEWEACGFRSGSMLHNLEWLHMLEVEYDASTFDIDPFEPQPEGVGTIFPFAVEDSVGDIGYIELPYTLPQDFTLFILLGERNIESWKRKVDWIARHGGMVLVNVHPDYINFTDEPCDNEEYSAEYYRELLLYIKSQYKGEYWHALPNEVARYIRAKTLRA